MSLPSIGLPGLHVTLLYGGLSALLVTLLGLNVSLLRLRLRAFVTSGPNPELTRPVRAHGNAAEWVPLAVVLMAILELSGANATALHVLGGSFLFARLIHAYGFLFKSFVSTAGATLNYLVVSAMSGWAIWLHFAGR